jgi:dTDP-4-amino-4,6-dideoxygalactose transaminase
MKVPLLDLKRQYEKLQSEVNLAIQNVLNSQHFILGPEVSAFEKEICEYIKCKNAIGVSSGTDALLIALMALEVKPGDKIVTTPYSFFATAGVISRLGAIPIFVDIQSDTYNMDPVELEKALEKNCDIKACIPVHLYGQMANMEEIKESCDYYYVKIIEDAAQAIGATQEGKQAGTIGDLGCFSFFPSKNLGGAGDGGMIVCNDSILAERVKILRVHGSKPKYYHPTIGINGRLDEIQAAILRVKLKFLNEWTENRNRNASTYKSLFKEYGLSPVVVTLPATRDLNWHIYNQFVIRVSNRDELQKYLKAYEIGTEIYYPIPLHLQECYKFLGYKLGDFPESERAAKETLALPIFPELTIEEQEYVVTTICNFYRS